MEPRNKEIKNFSDKWIKGTENVAKDAVEKHVKGEPHLQAVKLSKRSELGAKVYRDSVIMNLPLAKGFLRLNPADKDSLRAKFNTTYYVLKKERLFTDYPDLLNLQTKNRISELGASYSTLDASAYFADYIGKVMCEDHEKLISKANCFSVLSDSNTDSAVTEQEMIYVLFICEGTPVLKYLSIENVKNADAPGLKSTLEVAFNRLGITRCYNKLVGLNLDGASISMGKHNGLNVLVRDEAPWVEVVHCFNHQLELAIKDAFIESTFCSNID